VITQKIMSEFLQNELKSIKISRDNSIEEEKIQESPEQHQRDTDYDLIKEIKSEPSPAHETRVPHQEIIEESKQLEPATIVNDDENRSLDAAMTTE
jgi:hypothetical protein